MPARIVTGSIVICCGCDGEGLGAERADDTEPPPVPVMSGMVWWLLDCLSLKSDTLPSSQIYVLSRV